MDLFSWRIGFIFMTGGFMCLISKSCTERRSPGWKQHLGSLVGKWSFASVCPPRLAGHGVGIHDKKSLPWWKYCHRHTRTSWVHLDHPSVHKCTITVYNMTFFLSRVLRCSPLLLLVSFCSPHLNLLYPMLGGYYKGQKCIHVHA